MNDEPIRIRQIDGAQILDTMNCATIAERFFGRSRAWFTQRLNNNIVNGKPISFKPQELRTLRSALETLAAELNDFAANLPTDDRSEG